MATQGNAEIRGDERGTLLIFLAGQRAAVRRAVLGLTDEQAAATPSVSALSLSGLVKHVAETEQGWVARARRVAPDMQRTEANWADSFRLVGDESVESALAYWDKVALATEEFIRSCRASTTRSRCPAITGRRTRRRCPCGGCCSI
ncbi:DinB family protein [Streptomyces sp. NPDC057696]|uniref:DinB family protein n=1 Tax=Streptomyces sp. NPDC057696 TaxID=3346218 RepID=UPI0036A77EAC